MKVYACYHRLQALEFWEIISDDVVFITASNSIALEWEKSSEEKSSDGLYVHIKYYKEFNLQ